MSSKNILLRTKVVGLTVARLDIMRLARRVCLLLAIADLVANLIAEAISMGFTWITRCDHGTGIASLLRPVQLSFHSARK